MNNILCLSLILLSTYGTYAEYSDGVDLTWPFDNETIYWGDSLKFKFTKKVVQDEPFWYTAMEFAAAEHGGTHLDAPYHLNKTNWKVGDIPLSHLTGTGIKIDLSEETKHYEHEARLLPKHLIDWERDNGVIPNHCIILVYFNWTQHYHNKAKYLGGETTNDYKFPAISEEAAQWIVDTGKVIGVGLDTASVDPGGAIALGVHRKFANHNIYNLENVNIPSTLPAKGYRVFAMPMRIAEGSGAPVRIVAYPTQS